MVSVQELYIQQTAVLARLSRRLRVLHSLTQIMVRPPRLVRSHRLSSVLAFAIIASFTLLKHSDCSFHVVYGWTRGGHNMNIHGHPRRTVQSSSMFMKKRGKKRGRGKSKGNRDKKDGDETISDVILSSDYEVTNGVVSRLEAIYGMDTFQIKGQDWISDNLKLHGQTKNFQRATIILEDWMGMAEGLCLDDCCGDECDEQCDIPEDYKRFTRTDAPKVDVMSFLGIKRPQPLRVQRDWD